MELTPLAARSFAAILEERTGQQLGGGRRWRLETALQPVLRACGAPSLDALAARAARGPDGDTAALRVAIAEALLNHETSFFRDRAAFEALRDRALPRLAERRGGSERLRIWSAGCATGQETYSIAMLLADERWRGWRVDLLGTDVSGAAVARARAGLYSKLEVQRGLAVGELLAHFEEADDLWRLRPEVAARARFAEAGLLDLLPAGPFDLILCRNVLLYFDEARRRAALARLAEALAPGGMLLLGAGETALGHVDALELDPDFRGFYRRAEA